MPDKFRPLFLRFSLRTLFVLMTVLCCWLGWELSIVRQRKAVRREFEAKGILRFVAAEDYARRYLPGVPSEPIASVPHLRRWLGDEAIQEILFERWRHEFSEADLVRAQQVFPEAKAQELLAEPCHPGCFPAGTLVETDEGARTIESLVPGDRTIIHLPTGKVAVATVSEIFVTENWLWKVETDGGDLITTQTQPLCVAWDEAVQVGKLKRGDMILQQRDGAILEVKVLSVTPTEKSAKVYNLILGDAEVFVAGGFVARSKPPAVVER